MNFPFFPPAASTTATRVDYIYFFLVVFSVFIMAVVFLPMIYFLFK